MRLKELRKQAKLSQTELAKIFNIAQNTLSNWENGNRMIDMTTAIEIAKFFNVSVDYLLGRDEVPSSPTSNGTWIPVLGKVQAGIPVEAIQDIIDYEDISNISKDPAEYFALQVKGASMEPKFSEGDVVIVKKQDTAEDGEIVIALVNGDEATIKKLKKRADGIDLLPLNQQFDMMYYTADDIEKLPVRILGKVVELRSRF